MDMGSGRARYALEAAAALGITLGLLWAVDGWSPTSAGGAVGGGPRCRGASSEIASVGDILLGDAAQKRLDKHGFDYPFRKIAPVLAGADLLMGNLEAPITEHDVQYVEGKKWSYRQHPAAAEALRSAGFDVLALANNHTLDFGPVGLLDTFDQLDAVGIEVIGAGRGDDDARKGSVVELPGGTVGLLAYMEPYGHYERNKWFARGETPGCARMDHDAIQQDIARLRELADVVIVHCHFGRNYKPPTRYQERMAHSLIDMGADVVNGHHPHVAQGVEIYKGKPIVYSLGNFTFGTPGRFPKGEQGYGLVARYRLCGQRITSIALQLIAVNNKLVRYQPRSVEEQEARPVLEELMEPYGTPLRWQDGTAVIDLPGR